MTRHAVIAVKLLLINVILLGVIYPLAMTGLGQLLFPKQTNGSLVRLDGRVIGSELIGQPFADPGYFHPRPSAAGSGYDASASGGSNLGPTSAALTNRVTSARLHVVAENSGLDGHSIPVDMLTASGSGLDPDISIANALAQAARVAHARKMPQEAVRRLISANTTGRRFGILGEPRVNVLKLNLALDARAPAGRP